MSKLLFLLQAQELKQPYLQFHFLKFFHHKEIKQFHYQLKSQIFLLSLFDYAQKSRGADFSNGSLVKRAKALIPILIPLLASAFNRADELATAMECRCYRGDNNRTKLVELKLAFRDYAWLFVFFIIFAATVCLGILPYKFSLNNVIFDILFFKV